MGGEAIANGGSVSDRAGVQSLVDDAMNAWGRIDVLINNAGILRDKSFAKMTLDDFQLVMDVHLMGAANCSHAVWPIMREQNYGRILMTTSPTGLYGNFGQANYGAAKLAQVGLMHTLKIEGAKNNIQVNFQSKLFCYNFLNNNNNATEGYFLRNYARVCGERFKVLLSSISIGRCIEPIC